MSDPKIKYDVEANVIGETSINEMAQRLEDMGKILDGDLAPAAKVAATEMRALGDQQAAILAFAQLSEQSRNIEHDLSLAKSSARSFNEEITAFGPPTEQQAAMLGRLNDQVKNSQTKFDEQKVALSAANQELLKYGLTGDRLIESQRQTTASVASLKAGVQASIPAFQSAGDEGVASARHIQDAWSTLGVKSFTQTQTEIAKVKAALETVKAAGASPLEIKIATEAAQAQIKQLESGVKSVGAASAGAAGIFRELAPLMAATFGVNHFIETINAAETLNRSFTQLFGSTEAARKEMEFIDATANKLGVDDLELARSYQTLAAATKGTTLEGQATRDVFEAVSLAMGVLGKSSAETNNALEAVAKMASTGTVSIGELRKQLGSALPGALKAAADGAGVTVDQLTTLIKTGDVLAKDLLPALAKGLKDLYAGAPPPATVLNEWARFKNAIDAASIALGEGGVSQGLARSLTGVTTVAVGTSAAIDAVATAAKNLYFQSDKGSESSRIYNQNLLMGDATAKALGLSLEDARKAQEKLAAAQKAADPDTQELYRHQGMLNRELDAAVESALKIAVSYGELKKGSEDYVGQVQKEITARTAEAQVLTTLVGLYGTDQEKHQVAATAAATLAAETEKLAAAQNTQALIANSYVIKLREQALATNDTTDTTVKAIDAAQKDATAKQTEYEKTAALSNAKQIDVVATQAQALAYQDNSGKVAEYAASLKVAEFEVGQLIQAHKEGKASDEDVAVARKNLAGITILYKDAVGDVVTKLQAKQIADKANATVTEIALNAQKTYYKAMEDSAKAAGDYNLALYASIEQKKIDIKIIEAHVAAMKVEAAGAIAVAKAQLAVLDASGKVDPVQRAQIEASIKIAEAKIKEADALGLSTEAIQREIDKLKNGADANRNFTDATNGVTAALERKNAAMEKDIAAQEKQLDLAKRQQTLDYAKRGLDSEGWATNTTGQRVTGSFERKTPKNVYDLAIQGGATEAEAQSLAQKFGTDITAKIGYSNIPGSFGALNHTFDQTKFEQALSDLVMSRRGTGSTGNTGSTGSQSGGGTNHTYTINIPGYGNFNVASEADVSSAQAVIAALLRAKGNAGG